MLIVHILRVILTGAFRPPRLLTYFVGLGLFLVIFLIYFAGTVLRWDQEGYEALTHFLAVNKLLGPIGAFFQDDFTLSTSILSRIFALHISNLQIIFIAILILHIFYIKYFGISPKPYQTEEDYQSGLDGQTTFIGHAKLLGILSATLNAKAGDKLTVEVKGLVGTKTATFSLTGLSGKVDLGQFPVSSDDFTQVLELPADLPPGSYRLTVEGGGKSAKVVITIN